MEPLTIIIDNRVRVCVEGVDKKVVRNVQQGFEHVNPAHAMKRRMGIPAWGEPPIIRTWREFAGSRDEPWLSLPRGGMPRVCKALQEAGHDIHVIDSRETGITGDIPDHNRELYEHQRTIVKAAIEKEQCIIVAPTGSGKTSALIAIAAELNVPTLVVVHSQALLDQWKERVHLELGLPPRQIGIVQGQRVDLKPITLSIQKTMAKIAEESAEVRRYFGCVIADEVHLFAAKTFFNCIDPFPARYRIGASADHKRKDRKEFLIHDLFGGVAADIKRENLIESGHVLDVEIRAVPTDFAAPWYGIPEEVEEETKDEKKHLDFVRLVKEMADDPERNWKIIRLARDEVAQGDQVLVMAHEREHCMRLGQTLHGMGTSVGYLLGGDESRQEFRRTVDGLKAGTVRVGVGTYKAIGTGIDIPRIGVGIAATPIAGNKQFFGQVRGRVCRTSKGKTGARIYVMWDRFVYPKHIKNLMAWNAEVVVREETGDYTPARHWMKAV